MKNNLDSMSEKYLSKFLNFFLYSNSKFLDSDRCVSKKNIGNGIIFKDLIAYIIK